MFYPLTLKTKKKLGKTGIFTQNQFLAKSILYNSKINYRRYITFSLYMFLLEFSIPTRNIFRILLTYFKLFMDTFSFQFF